MHVFLCLKIPYKFVRCLKNITIAQSFVKIFSPKNWKNGRVCYMKLEDAKYFFLITETFLNYFF